MRAIGCVERMPLQEQTNLHRRYTVGRVLAEDAYSFTYAGMDTKARQAVMIREFFPELLAARTADSSAVSPQNKSCGELFFLASEAFRSQYAVLTQAIGNANIISVFDAFFANGTAYAITEPEEGVSLAEYVRMQERPLLEGELAYIAKALSDALLVVHSLSIMHHDITAENILLCTDGTVKLTDFGAARVTVRDRRQTDEAQPWKDLQGLGRALYEAYTGQPVPTDAAQCEKYLSPMLAGVLERMLTDDPSLRFDSVFDFLHAAEGLDIRPVRPRVTTDWILAYRQTEQARATQQERLERARMRERNRPQLREAQKNINATTEQPRMRPLWILACGIVLLGTMAALLIRYLR